MANGGDMHLNAILSIILTLVSFLFLGLAQQNPDHEEMYVDAYSTFGSAAIFLAIVWSIEFRCRTARNGQDSSR